MWTRADKQQSAGLISVAICCPSDHGSLKMLPTFCVFLFSVLQLFLTSFRLDQLDLFVWPETAKELSLRYFCQQRQNPLQLVNGEIRDTQCLPKASLSKSAKLLCSLAFSGCREITGAESCLCLSTWLDWVTEERIHSRFFLLPFPSTFVKLPAFQLGDSTSHCTLWPKNRSVFLPPYFMFPLIIVSCTHTLHLIIAVNQVICVLL